MAEALRPTAGHVRNQTPLALKPVVPRKPATEAQAVVEPPSSLTLPPATPADVLVDDAADKPKDR